MDNTKYVNVQIEEEIQGFCNIIEKHVLDDEPVWFMELQEFQFMGFISSESNKGDIDIPTISMALVLFDIGELTKNQLLELFSLNGNFHGCCLSAENFNGHWKLMLNRRIMTESYQPGELWGNFALMLERFSVFEDNILQIINS